MQDIRQEMERAFNTTKQRPQEEKQPSKNGVLDTLVGILADLRQELNGIRNEMKLLRAEVFVEDEDDGPYGWVSDPTPEPEMPAGEVWGTFVQASLAMKLYLDTFEVTADKFASDLGASPEWEQARKEYTPYGVGRKLNDPYRRLVVAYLQMEEKDGLPTYRHPVRNMAISSYCQRRLAEQGYINAANVINDPEKIKEHYRAVKRSDR